MQSMAPAEQDIEDVLEEGMSLLADAAEVAETVTAIVTADTSTITVAMFPSSFAMSAAEMVLLLRRQWTGELRGKAAFVHSNSSPHSDGCRCLLSHSLQRCRPSHRRLGRQTLGHSDHSCSGSSRGRLAALRVPRTRRTPSYGNNNGILCVLCIMNAICINIGKCTVRIPHHNSTEIWLRCNRVDDCR